MSRKVLDFSTGLANSFTCSGRPSGTWPCWRHRPGDISSRFLQLGSKRRRCLATQAEVYPLPREAPIAELATNARSPHLGHVAKQRQADREFFADLLSSAATKRDAKAYLSRLRSPKKKAEPKHRSGNIPSRQDHYKPTVNVGNLFGRAAAVDQSPIFAQYADVQGAVKDEVETVHVALVKIVGLHTLDEKTLQGIAQTLSQLSRLSMSPCVVLEQLDAEYASGWRQRMNEQVDKLASAIDRVHGPGARKVDDLFSIAEAGTQPKVSLRKLLLRPLRRGRIPIVVPSAYSSMTQSATPISANDVLLALTKEFAGVNIEVPIDEDPDTTAARLTNLQEQISLDKIILIDASGAIPSMWASEKTHVFVNLEQEYSGLQKELAEARDAPDSARHSENLTILRDTLKYLSPAASGLITTPYDAANANHVEQEQTQVSGVGTRRKRNPLIHNLLTDKPAYSSSLPSGRLGRMSGKLAPHTVSPSTFVKRGMPLTILPDPTLKMWTAANHGEPRLKLTDPRLDLPRLVHLINDSFNRELDVGKYLERVNDRIAGVIIAGEYEGGALLTWETPPGADDRDTSRLVPYLDKFAVLKRSQGSGGVADILFNTMVRTCFPMGVCWRSRKDNPVNKWYFERARGTWKIPETNWTMFWTTPGVVEQGQTFLDYEGVCRGVLPTWADKQKVVD